MNNITVTVELCAEDRARLDRIAELLTPVTMSDPLKKVAVPTEPAPAAPVAAAEEKPTENPPEAEKPAEAAPVPADAELLKAELKALVQKLIASGQRDATRAIVQQYATRVSDVPEDKRAECIEQLKALEVKA